ncbi:YqaA family protein [Chloroflexota bacterium]
MSSITYNGKEAEVEKRGRLREKVIPPLTLLLVIAITVALFLFQNRVAELGHYGYLGSFLISLVANATIILPMPSILLLFALGATFNPVLVGLTGAAGGALGEMTGYMIGYSGHGIARNSKVYTRAEGWLRKWGVLTIFVFAATPSPFDMMGMVAGLLRYPFWKFFLALLLGKIFKYVSIALAGAWGWEAFVIGLQLISSMILIVVLAAVATLAFLALALVIEDRAWKRVR